MNLQRPARRPFFSGPILPASPRVIALCVLVLACAATASTAIDVTGPVNITSPGTYVLQNDILTSPKTICINISSSDVIFDGNSSLIDGVDAVGSYGIYVHNNNAALSNVTVRNVRTQDWQHGVFFYNAMYGSVENCTAGSNTQYGIYLSIAGNVTVRDNSVMSNGQRGIAMDFTRNTTVESTTMRANPYGVRLSFSYNNTLQGNVIEGNTFGAYFTQSSGNAITNTTFNNTYNAGFADTASSNFWNRSKTAGAGITGGPYSGGNAWLYPNGTGFSEVTEDRDYDGICDLPFMMNAGNTDQLPLALVTGQHDPAFAASQPLRMLLPGDGSSPSHPTALYFVFDGSAPDGRAGDPDTLRFAVDMEDAGLSVTANVSELDGTLTPLTPVSVAGTRYYFSHILGAVSLGNTSSLLRRIPVSAQIGRFGNTTNGTGPRPDPLVAVANANFSRSSPWISGTDWRTIRDFSNAEGLVFANASTTPIGSINFSTGVDLCDPDFAALMDGPITAVQITEGNATIDTSATGIAVLNASSRITLACHGCTNAPAVLAGESVACYANGTLPSGSPVTALTWDNGTKEVSFSVAHWTTYRVHGSGPGITITVPADGTVTDGGTVQIEGTADDPFGVSRVEIRANCGAWVPATGTTLWNATVTLDPGENTISVRGTNSLECNASAAVRVIRTAPPMVRAGGAGGSLPVAAVTVTQEPPAPMNDSRIVTIVSPDHMAVAYVPITNGTDTRNLTYRFVGVDPSFVILDSSYENATVLCAYALEPPGTVCDPLPARVVFMVPEGDNSAVTVAAQDGEEPWEIITHDPAREGKITFTTDRFSRYALIRFPQEGNVPLTTVPTGESSTPYTGEDNEPVPQQKSGTSGWITGAIAVFGFAARRFLR